MDCVHDFKRHGFCACDRLKVQCENKWLPLVRANKSNERACIRRFFKAHRTTFIHFKVMPLEKSNEFEGTITLMASKFGQYFFEIES